LTNYSISAKLIKHLFFNNLKSCLLQPVWLAKSFLLYLCTQLLCALNKTFCAFDTNNSVDLIYTDIAKGFDSVSHPKFISVLLYYRPSITGNLLKWIECFLTNRT